MPYTERQRRYIYAQAAKGIRWAQKEVSKGAAKHLKRKKKRR